MTSLAPPPRSVTDATAHAPADESGPRREDATHSTAAPSSVARSSRPIETVYRPRHPLNLAATVLFQRRGSHDPTMATAGSVIWRAARTPQGVATLALRGTTDGSVRAAAWGPGAEWALDQVPALCGGRDDITGFEPSRHPLIAALAHRNPGLRLGRTDLVFDALVSSVFEQKVTGLQAFAAWRRLVTWHGTPAPGPTPRPMFAPPPIAGWHRIPSWDWHRAGLEPPQARTIVRVAERGDALVRAIATSSDSEQIDRVLLSQPGIGPWSAAETRIKALGDPDAVSVGDYHLAHDVGYALTGSRTDDDGMLELLSPWAGHRQRVIRLLESGAPREPRRGARLHPEDHRSR